MSANPVYPYDFQASSSYEDDFQRLGHPGKWVRSITVTADTFFTGSNYGAGALIVSGATGTVELTGGGTVDIAALPAGLTELSIDNITSPTGTIYVLIRNQVIR